LDVTTALSNSSYNNNHSAGFTLIELMVTIAVLAIIVSIAAPNVSTQLANQRVKSTAVTLENALKEAKAESVIRRQSITLVVDQTNKTIKLQRIVDKQVESTLATYTFNLKSAIKSDSTNTKFEPSKVANAMEYTICDNNTSISPMKVVVSATAAISTKSEGDCT